MSATEPEGTEIYLVTVGRHAFGSGASLQEPNTIRDAEDRSEGFDDDPSTPLIDEAEVYGLIEADPYFTASGTAFTNHGVRYTPRGLFSSPPRTFIGISQKLPPQYIYQGTSGFTNTGDPQMSYMEIEIYPEGYDNRSTTVWEVTSISASVTSPITPTGYDFVTAIDSDHGVLGITNTKWPTVPFSTTYRCVMEDFTKVNFDSIEEAQAATNPEVLSLYELDLGDPIIDHIQANIAVDIVFTNSVNNNTFSGSLNLRQNVYSKSSDYISKVQALNPPGTMGAPGTEGFPDLPDGT